MELAQSLKQDISLEQKLALIDQAMMQSQIKQDKDSGRPLDNNIPSEDPLNLLLCDSCM